MIAIIVAYSKNRVIGNKGKIPWNIKNEKQRFKQLTTDNVVVMGRKTFEEIGKPLPNRITVVVSATKLFDTENCYTVSSLDEAIRLCEIKFPKRNIYISGGARLYKEALSIADKIYATEIDATLDGDVFFPFIDESQYEKTVEEKHHEEIAYKYITYTKKGLEQ